MYYIYSSIILLVSFVLTIAPMKKEEFVQIIYGNISKREYERLKRFRSAHLDNLNHEKAKKERRKSREKEWTEIVEAEKKQKEQIKQSFEKKKKELGQKINDEYGQEYEEKIKKLEEYFANQRFLFLTGEKTDLQEKEKLII